MSFRQEPAVWRIPALLSVLALLACLLLLPSGLERRLKSLAMSLEHPFLGAADGLVRGYRAAVSGGQTHEVEMERVLDLMTTNVRLRLDLAGAATLQAENEFLKQRLGFRSRNRRLLVVCRVDGRSLMNGYYRQLRLNRGRVDGLEPGMAIVTEAGLVGRLAEVFRDTSTAELISNPRCMVPCHIPSKELHGVLIGGAVAGTDGILSLLAPPPGTRLDFVSESPERRLAEGDWVYTSGLGDGIEADTIPVGVISAVERDAAGIYRSCRVSPFASLEHLSYVYAVVSN